MPLEQLIVLYHHYSKEEQQRQQETYDIITSLHEVWSEKFEGYSRFVAMFSNPDLFSRYLQEEELSKHREDVSEENFADVWDSLLEVVPQTLNIHEEHTNKEAVPIDPEIDEQITGWLQRSKRFGHLQKEAGE